jgi:hypothetical protein
VLNGRELAGVVGGGEQQHAARASRAGGHARAERRLDRAADGRRPDDRLDAVELRRAERRRQLEQRQRVAVRGLQQPRRDLARHRAVQARAEQRLGVSLVEAADLELASPGASNWRASPARAAISSAIGSASKASRGEDQRLGRRRVEPLRVVDAAQHRARLAGLGEQAEQAGETRKRSCTPSKLSPSAPRSAAAWGAGRRSTSSRHGRTSWCMPAKGSSCSASIPSQRSTVMSRALSAAYSSSAVLPMPGSPRSTSAALHSSRALCSTASRADRSDSRPTSISCRV